MKNKIIFAIVLAVIFVGSSILFSQARITSQGNIDMTVGLGAMVLSYFVSRLSKSRLLKQ